MDNKEIISDKPNYLDPIFNELVELQSFTFLTVMCKEMYTVVFRQR